MPNASMLLAAMFLDPPGEIGDQVFVVHLDTEELLELLALRIVEAEVSDVRLVRDEHGARRLHHLGERFQDLADPYGQGLDVVLRSEFKVWSRHRSIIVEWRVIVERRSFVVSGRGMK